MCIDLCFHIQEHRFTMAKLSELLDSSGVTFLGFVLPQSIKDQYSKENKDDNNQLDLTRWSNFEELHPETFRSMYQFWIKKK